MLARLPLGLVSVPPLMFADSDAIEAWSCLVGRVLTANPAAVMDIGLLKR